MTTAAMFTPRPNPMRYHKLVKPGDAYLHARTVFHCSSGLIHLADQPHTAGLRLLTRTVNAFSFILDRLGQYQSQGENDEVTIGWDTQLLEELEAIVAGSLAAAGAINDTQIAAMQALWDCAMPEDSPFGRIVAKARTLVKAECDREGTKPDLVLFAQTQLVPSLEPAIRLQLFKTAVRARKWTGETALLIVVECVARSTAGLITGKLPANAYMADVIKSMDLRLLRELQWLEYVLWMTLAGDPSCQTTEVLGAKRTLPALLLQIEHTMDSIALASELYLPQDGS